MPLHVEDRPQEVKIATCSADKARKFFNYKTKTKIEDAVKKTVQFIKERGTRDFDYNLPLEIKNFKTPSTWRDKTI